ncbi:unnamed protein product [Parajaminaea phylloscopi]
MSSSGSKAGIDFDQSVGSVLPSQPVSWNRRDILLYNVGVGVGEEVLDYNYEKSEAFRALPTYPLVLPFKGDSGEVNDFAELVSGRGEVPGFPTLDPNTLVHAEQSLIVHRTLPLISGSGWQLKKQITAVADKKTGLISEATSFLVDPVGHVYATMVSSSFYRGGGQGTGYNKSISGPYKVAAASPPAGREGKPDFTQSEKTSPAQAIVYRLSGDYNPLHIDPAIGAQGGLGGVILHGLCSYGFATRAILRSVNPQDGVAGAPVSALRKICARFTSPVKPGNELRTDVWILNKDARQGGQTRYELAFEQVNLATGKKALGGGYAEVIVKEGGDAAGSKL